MDKNLTITVRGMTGCGLPTFPVIGTALEGDSVLLTSMVVDRFFVEYGLDRDGVEALVRAVLDVDSFEWERLPDIRAWRFYANKGLLRAFDKVMERGQVEAKE